MTDALGSRRDLVLKALGLLDALTERQTEAAISGINKGARITVSGINKGARITVSPIALHDLLASVEAAYPGILDVYLDTRGIRRIGAK